MPQFPQGPTCCSTAQRQVLANSLDVAAKWSKAHGYPLHLGEFGSNLAGDMQSRENYTRMARDLLEANGIGWTYWEFGSTFGVYDPAKAMWIEPIRRALLD
jgi:endoglucanase